MQTWDTVVEVSEFVPHNITVVQVTLSLQLIILSAYVVSKNPIISKIMSSNMVHESAKVKEKMTKMLTL